MLNRRLLGIVPNFRLAAPQHTVLKPYSLPINRTVSSTYFLKDTKGDDETERLAVQHRLALRMMNQEILHPSIPKSLKHVADVATGNAIWPLDLSQGLGGASSGTQFHGFDLTPRLFPKTYSNNIGLTIHNLYDAFPAEHREKYDVVHLRFLMMAIQNPSDLKAAVTNILSLLKPGGYLQWEEYDFIAQYNEPKSSPSLNIWRELLRMVEGEGYQLKLADDVFKELTAAGMNIIDHEAFNTAKLGHDIDLRLTWWYALEIGIPMLAVRKQGKSPEVLAQAYKDVEMCREEIGNGLVLDYFLERLVFRKPLKTI